AIEDDLAGPIDARREVRARWIDDEEIRLLSRGERADSILQAEYLCAADGRQAQRVHHGGKDGRGLAQRAVLRVLRMSRSLQADRVPHVHEHVGSVVRAAVEA